MEIGSFEGASTCYLIHNLSKDNQIEIHYIDPWELETSKESDQKFYGSNIDMSNVEKRFRNNTDIFIEKSVNKVDFFVHKGFSDDELSNISDSESDSD